MKLPNTRLSILALSMLLMAGAAAADSVLAHAALADAADAPVYKLREHYTKYEFRIPMRDGVRLFTAVYV
ncbi:MAG TPA: hypothetical protein VGP06_09420, partial [Janthinobacterium sp.]|nr:hypothetical protein [Janthinobacterium sp.]